MKRFLQDVKIPSLVDDRLGILPSFLRHLKPGPLCVCVESRLRAMKRNTTCDQQLDLPGRLLEMLGIDGTNLTQGPAAHASLLSGKRRLEEFQHAPAPGTKNGHLCRSEVCLIFGYLLASVHLKQPPKWWSVESTAGGAKHRRWVWKSEIEGLTCLFTKRYQNRHSMGGKNNCRTAYINAYVAGCSPNWQTKMTRSPLNFHLSRPKMGFEKQILQDFLCHKLAVPDLVAKGGRNCRLDAWRKALLRLVRAVMAAAI